MSYKDYGNTISDYEYPKGSVGYAKEIRKHNEYLKNWGDDTRYADWIYTFPPEQPLKTPSEKEKQAEQINNLRTSIEILSKKISNNSENAAIQKQIDLLKVEIDRISKKQGDIFDFLIGKKSFEKNKDFTL